MKALYTVKKNSDFRRIYARGKSAVTPYMVVYCRKNQTQGNRTGYTVSAKLGHAVIRNRIKRRLREVYRENSASLRNGFDLIIVARSRAVNAEYSALSRSFLECCTALNLLNKAETRP